MPLAGVVVAPRTFWRPVEALFHSSLCINFRHLHPADNQIEITQWCCWSVTDAGPLNVLCNLIVSVQSNVVSIFDRYGTTQFAMKLWTTSFAFMTVIRRTLSDR